MRLAIARRVAVAMALLIAAPAVAQDNAPPQTILFVGNSFTFGALSPVWKYRAASVTDLNHDGVGGVPALFKLFTQEAGLDYAVSLETAPGKSLQWHWDNRRGVIDRAWDHVVLQEYSTLDPEAPGNPARLIDYARRLAGMVAARNPKVEVSLTATWSRPDQVYRQTGHWYGQPIAQMALDIRRANDAAAAAAPAIDKVHPVGQAFTCAISAGVADPDPYDGTSFGTVDLWSWDHYHASVFGYYLEALTVFADVTGKDPRTLGADETAAQDLGISPRDAVRLQRVAATAIAGVDCARAAA
jgi:hypothetical protein